METNVVEENKDGIGTIRTPSISTVSHPSARYFDARSWEDNRDLISLRIQSPASELYLDEEFSPSTIIGSPNSIVEIKTPQIVGGNKGGVQAEEKQENDVYLKGDPNEGVHPDVPGGGRVFSSSRLFYVVFTLLIGFIFIIGILGAFFYLGRSQGWDEALLRGLEFNVEDIYVDFGADHGSERVDTSLLVDINAPSKEGLQIRSERIVLPLENVSIEWDSNPVAKIDSPNSLDIFQSDRLSLMVHAVSNSTHMVGISGIIHDIITRGQTEVLVKTQMSLPGKNNNGDHHPFISKKFTISMPLRELITNIQLYDVSLDREIGHNSNIILSSKVSYDYRGRVFINNLGKIFLGVFHGNSYLGIVKLEDSDMFIGAKSEMSLRGTLNMHNLIKDEVILKGLRPSLDFGENTSHNIPIRTFDLDVHGVGSSSPLLDSAIRLVKTSLNLAILPPPPLRQIPIPSITVESVVITPQLMVQIKGKLRTTFYGYLISNNETPRLESLSIKGLLGNGGKFIITTKDQNQGVQDQDGPLISHFPELVPYTEGDTVATGINHGFEESSNHLSSLNDGIPYTTITISPYTDHVEVPVNFELLFEDFSDAYLLNNHKSSISASEIQILSGWSFFTGRHSELKRIDQSNIELEMFSFLPRILEFQTVDGIFQAQITLQLIHLGDSDHGETSYSGPIKVTWFCNREFGAEFQLSSVLVKQIAANYVLSSNQLIPGHCTLENSKLKVEIAR
ncbi:transmembrane domain-containing protein [Cryptosporidium canis]|uniref:Transmembrane domain-containing protein n=1 Tax=Cryptosporidium canis TaxID=195482 RepID=A0A9D5HXQ4_9CRYT|nr:transmembrane domain-containing protein [Cryptosporidium canis]